MNQEEKDRAKYMTVPDVITHNLSILFCGINPGLMTAFAGHHYARPGNRFWKALFESGFTPRLLKPEEDSLLPNYGLGLTNLVARASVAASEVSKEEFINGGKILISKLEKYKPQWVAFVGIQAYRVAFNQPKAQPGEQNIKLAESRVWVLPSTSGLNAHYAPKQFADEFQKLKDTILRK